MSPFLLNEDNTFSNSFAVLQRLAEETVAVKTVDLTKLD